MIDDNFDRLASLADLANWCKCGDHESEHFEGIFMGRREDGTPGRACATPFCWDRQGVEVVLAMSSDKEVVCSRSSSA